MASLFDKGFIGELELKNRIIRSATWEGMCDPDGRPTQKLIDYYAALARGGIGLIITGYTYVRTEGKQMPGKMGLYNEAFASDFRQMTKTVHDLGGKIAIQLVHAGGQADSKTSGQPAVAPSRMKFKTYPEEALEMSILQAEAITDAFAMAAKRAKKWGFDAVQIHGAHGYLVNQFLSPLTNHRNDAYGGNLENRSRFLFDVYEKIRSGVGKNYPVLIKLTAADHLENGFTRQEGEIVSQMLSSAGIDAIEISSGTAASGDLGPARKKINTPDKEAYNLDLAASIKAHVTCPVISVGGFRSLDVAEQAVSSGHTDFISLSRPLIREPDLPNKWQQNATGKSECVSCNKCFIPGLSQGGIYCVPLQKKLNKKE